MLDLNAEQAVDEGGLEGRLSPYEQFRYDMDVLHVDASRLPMSGRLSAIASAIERLKRIYADDQFLAWARGLDIFVRICDLQREADLLRNLVSISVGKAPESKEARDARLRAAFAVSGLSAHAFALAHDRDGGLTYHQIRRVVSRWKCATNAQHSSRKATQNEPPRKPARVPHDTAKRARPRR